MVETEGFEPLTLRMRTVRSPKWASNIAKIPIKKFQGTQKIRKKGTNDDEFVFLCSECRMRCIFSNSVRGVVSHAPDLRGTSVKLNEIKGPFLRSIVKAAFFMPGNVYHGETHFLLDSS